MKKHVIFSTVLLCLCFEGVVRAEPQSLEGNHNVVNTIERGMDNSKLVNTDTEQVAIQNTSNDQESFNKRSLDETQLNSPDSNIQPKNENREQSKLPFILSIIATVLGLAGLIYGYLLGRKLTLNNEQLNQELQRLKNKEVTHRKNLDDLHEYLKVYQAQINRVVDDLQVKVQHLEILLNKQNTTQSVAKNNVNFAKLITMDNSVVVKSERSLDFDTATVKVEEPAINDEDILDSISDSINQIFAEFENKLTADDFKKAYEANQNHQNIQSYMLLKSDLKNASSRGFEAVVLFLKEQLSNGANTLVYLQKNTVQHSAISALFENVRDGVSIKETIQPAQLKNQNPTQFELIEDYLVQKGEVLVG